MGRLAIYAFLGQSNAVGTAEPPTGDNLLPGVYVFGNNYRWRQRIEPLDDAEDQVDLVSLDRQVGYGAATAFAKRIRERNPAIPVGLISCSRGGSTISMWQPSLSEATLVGACHKRLLAASTAGRIAGVVFLQGERDAVNPLRSGEKAIYPAQWADRFTTMALGFRQQLGLENLPVALGILGTPPVDHQRFSGWDQVKAQQALVSLPCVAAVPTDEIQKMPDGLHYTTQGFDLLGSSLAESMIALERAGCGSKSQPAS